MDLPYGLVVGEGDAGQQSQYDLHLQLGGAGQLYQLDRLDSWNIQSI